MGQRSPFITAVPSGRWIEKKERAPQVPFSFGLNDTPVRAALENDRALKITTIKKLMSVQSTTKKENAPQMTSSKKAPFLKSKKKILGEFNAVAAPKPTEPQIVSPESDLNTTFEILPDVDAEPTPQPIAEPSKQQEKARLRRSKSMTEIVREVAKVKVEKTLTPPVKQAPKPQQKKVLVKKPLVAKPVVLKKEPSKKVAAVTKPAPKPVIAKPVVRKPVATNPTKAVPKPQLPPSSPSDDEVEEVSFDEPEEEALKAAKTVSTIYGVYDVSITSQIKFISMRMNEVIGNKEHFMELLTEDQQTFVHQTVQHSNLIVNEKLSKFRETLDEFEESKQNSPGNPSKVTEDDIENYWYLIYDEIDGLKQDFNKIQEMKTAAMAVINSTKKRRTRRTYVPDEGTPKRSRRIADNADTPKCVFKLS